MRFKITCITTNREHRRTSSLGAISGDDPPVPSTPPSMAPTFHHRPLDSTGLRRWGRVVRRIWIDVRGGWGRVDPQIRGMGGSGTIRF
jgi:hypothetical protein